MTTNETIARDERDELLVSCWHQFCIDTTVDGDEWMSDGCLSTLESVADYLVKTGYLVKHQSHRLYRVNK